MSAAFDNYYSTNDPDSSAGSPEERLSAATAYLNAHFGRMAPGERFAINTLDKPRQSFSHREFTADQIAEAAAYAINKAETHDVYVSMAITDASKPPVKRGKRFKAGENVAGGYTLWIEVDYTSGSAHQKEHLPPTIEDSIELAGRLGVAPSEIISSGSGIHVSWFLTERLDRERLAEVELGLQRAIQGYAEQRDWEVDPTGDVARVLRISGTKNHKKWPVLADVTTLERSGTLYSVDQILDAIEKAPVPTKKSKGGKNLDAVTLDDGLVIDPNVVISDVLKSKMKTMCPKAWSTFTGERDAFFSSPSEKDLSLMSLMAKEFDAIDNAYVFTQQEIADATIHMRRESVMRRESGAPDDKKLDYYIPHTLKKVIAERTEIVKEAPEAGAVVSEVTEVSEAAEMEEEETEEGAAEIIQMAERMQQKQASGAAPVKARVAEVAEAQAGVEADNVIESAPTAAEQASEKPAVTQGFAYPLINASDVGNADRYVRIFRNTSRYISASKSWFVLDRDTVLWGDNSDQAAYDIRTVVEDIQRDIAKIAAVAANLGDGDDKKKADRDAKEARAWVRACQSGSHPETMLKQARAPLALSPDVSGSYFNRNPLAFATKDGAVDLKTGIGRKRVAEDYFTTRGTVNYVPGAQAPKWNAFINRIFAGDAKMIDYIQRALGYSLTGEVGEHKMFVLYGNGRNGKSTLTNVLSKIMGQYAGMLTTDSLTVKKGQGGNNANTDIADLRGVRMAVVSEANSESRFDEARIKVLTGGDPVKARHLFKDFGIFKPTHKFWLLTNHIPEVKGVDKGIWSRLVLIPMSVEIPDKEQVQNLDEKLIAEEGEGILAWLVEGALKWQERKLHIDVPEQIAKGTQDWRDDSDEISEFIELYCEIDTMAFTPSEDMLTAYRLYLANFKLDAKEGVSSKRLAVLMG
ncbi:MAG: DNA primase family protein, partial [Ktedonobacterales bacterium]